MLRERIYTNFILTKLIFAATFFCLALILVLGYMFLTMDAQAIIENASEFTLSFEESLSMDDNIEAVIIGQP